MSSSDPAFLIILEDDTCSHNWTSTKMLRVLATSILHALPRSPHVSYNMQA